MKNIPKEIYLNIGDAIDLTHCKDFKELHEVTWSESPINDTCIKFVIDKKSLTESLKAIKTAFEEN